MARNAAILIENLMLRHKEPVTVNDTASWNCLEPEGYDIGSSLILYYRMQRN